MMNEHDTHRTIFYYAVCCCCVGGWWLVGWVGGCVGACVRVCMHTCEWGWGPCHLLRLQPALPCYLVRCGMRHSTAGCQRNPEGLPSAVCITSFFNVNYYSDKRHLNALCFFITWLFICVAIPASPCPCARCQAALQQSPCPPSYFLFRCLILPLAAPFLIDYYLDV